MATSEMSPEEIEQEQQSYLRITEALKTYRDNGLAVMQQRRTHFENLADKYKELLGSHEGIFEQWTAALEANSRFLDSIAFAAKYLFDCYWPQGVVKELYERPTALDIDKVISTLKQFVRDWGEEGKAERQLTYDPIYASLQSYFPNRAERLQTKVLVPGSGLSRLAFELSLLGFDTQGNEFSHHMLIAGHFLLNHVSKREQIPIFPYVDQSINVFQRYEQFRQVNIPDMCPAEAIEELEAQGLAKGDFSMVAGDFLEVYNAPHEHGTWGSVVTCFFIDTAHNIFEYIETIHRLLAPGGLWVNVGPLLYHFSDAPNEVSVDLTYDELRVIIQKFGFTIQEERRIQSGYTVNACSMKWTVYNCIYFTAVKTGEPTGEHWGKPKAT